jgi:sugar lactone lactonase YvrE
MAHEIETHSTGPPWYKCNPRMALGEAPIYRASDSTLHWVDCFSTPPTLSILSIEPTTGAALGTARVLPLADIITVMFFRRDHPGTYICAYSQGVAILDEATGEYTVVKEIISAEDSSERRFNDGGIDALGRFWMAEIDKKAMAYGANGLPELYGRPKGRVWRYDPDGSLHLMKEDGLVCGNGLGWSSDNKKSEGRVSI